MIQNRTIYCVRVLCDECAPISPDDTLHVFTSLGGREHFLDVHPNAVLCCHKGEFRALGGLADAWIDLRPPHHPDHDIAQVQLERFQLQLA